MQVHLDLIYKIIMGEQTQMRRLWKCCEALYNADTDQPYVWRDAANGRHGLTRYQVGKVYAIQPGRGKPTIWWKPRGYHDTPTLWPIGAFKPDEIRKRVGYQPLRIRILTIRRHDVRLISRADALAEGFEDRWAFMQRWVEINDKTLWRQSRQGAQLTMLKIDSRPNRFYDAWALTFEVVK